MRGGTVDGPDIRNPFVCEAHYTYIHTNSVIGNPPQGEGFWKTPPQGQDFWNIHTFTYIHTSLALKNPPQGERFWKTLHRHSTFETYIPTSQSAVCYKYAFQNHPPCEGFLQSWSKTRLPVRVFAFSSHFGTARYVCYKTPLPVVTFAARHTYILA